MTTSLGQAYIRSALLVFDMLSGSSNTLIDIITKPAIVETISIPTSVGKVEARLYRPNNTKRHPALILSLGYPSNIKDPQVYQLSEDLARLGFVILTPQLPGLVEGNLSQGDVNILVESFEWLSVQPQVDSMHVGFSGFCVGSSLALVASQDVRIYDNVSIINVFGGYYDLIDYLRAVAAHSSLYQETEYPWEPAQQTVELFAQNLLFLSNPEDREILRKYFQTAKDDQPTPTGLSPLGKTIFAILTTTDPTTVDSLLMQFPAEIITSMNALSPEAGISRLKAKVFIMHDISDPYVPITESYRLRDSITNPEQIVYAQFALFEHVRPTRHLNKITLSKEAIRLIIYIGQLFNALPPKN